MYVHYPGTLNITNPSLVHTSRVNNFELVVRITSRDLLRSLAKLLPVILPVLRSRIPFVDPTEVLLKIVRAAARAVCSRVEVVKVLVPFSTSSAVLALGSIFQARAAIAL